MDQDSNSFSTTSISPNEQSSDMLQDPSTTFSDNIFDFDVITPSKTDLNLSSLLEMNWSSQQFATNPLQKSDPSTILLDGGRHWEMEHWVVAGILMPIVIALYLLLILVCYFMFCKKEPYNNNHNNGFNQNEYGFNQQSCPINPGSNTPPPSYAIFIGSGNSSMVPPTYKMLYPSHSSTSSDDQQYSPTNPHHWTP